jgi:hypothetical protein
MNINKFLKPLLPAVMVASTGMFIVGCNSSSDDPVFIPEDPPVPTEGITGIWTGELTRKDVPGMAPETYDIDMLFYMPDGETRGQSVASVFMTFPDPNDVSKHFLLVGGYEEVDDFATNEFGDLICDGEGWAVGRLGTNATFLRDFSYETGSQDGPQQRGAMCLQLSGNKLTGELQTENYDSFLVELTYSDENLIDSSVNDLTTGGIDTEPYHLWSNDNSGTSMSFSQVAPPTGDSLDVAVVENSNGCGGTVRITEIPGYNMYTLETLAPLAGCTIVTPGPGIDENEVDLSYRGMGRLATINNTNVFVHLMASFANVDSAQALYNEFTIQ